MTEGVPVVVADRSALLAAGRRHGILDPLSDPPTYVWAKGPPAAVAKALEAPPVEAAFVSSIDAFRKQPDVIAATRAFSYMRLMAVASGVLVFLGLVLYLGARQRSQAVASALTARMGLRRRTEILSLALELGAVTLVAAVVGGVVAVAAARPVVGHVDPLPDYPPGPTLAIPLAAILGSAVALVAVAVAAGAFTSWASRRTNMAEALRVV
jgi:putative ABC transport system permease protein